MGITIMAQGEGSDRGLKDSRPIDVERARCQTPRFNEEVEPAWAKKKRTKQRPNSAFTFANPKVKTPDSRPCSASAAPRRLPEVQATAQGTQRVAEKLYTGHEEPSANFYPSQQPGAKQTKQPYSKIDPAAKPKMVSRKRRGGWTGDLPLHLDEWFESKNVPRLGGLRLIETKPQDTLGPAASKPPKDYREPQKRIHGPSMIRPTDGEVQAGPKGLKISQRSELAEMPKEEGTRKYHSRETKVRKEGGLRICYTETGMMCKDQRSKEAKFTDFTGEKKRFDNVPGFMDPSREDPNSWPGMKGHAPNDVEGKYVDYTLKANGGFLSGAKFLNDTHMVPQRGSRGTPLEVVTNHSEVFERGCGAPSRGDMVPSHGARGKTRAQGIHSLLAWGS